MQNGQDGRHVHQRSRRREREQGLLAILPHRLCQLQQLLHAAHLRRLHKRLATKAQRPPLAHRTHVIICAQPASQPCQAKSMFS